MTLPGFIEKGIAHFATVEKFLAAQAEIGSANATIASQLTELDALRVENAHIKTELDTVKASVSGFEVKITQLQAAIDNPDGEIEKRAKAKALEIAAAQGVPPVPAEASTDVIIDKPDFSKLHGRAKFIAAEKWEREARSKRN